MGMILKCLTRTRKLGDSREDKVHDTMTCRQAGKPTGRQALVAAQAMPLPQK